MSMCTPTAPMLLLIGGSPGVGKSTLAQALSRALGWAIIDKDTIKSSLLGLGAEEQLASRASYVLMTDLAQDMLRARQSVILDAPGKYAAFLDRCSAIADDNDGQFRSILCEADRETRQKRLAERTPRISQWAMIPPGPDATTESWREAFPRDAIMVDTSGLVDDLVPRICRVLLNTDFLEFNDREWE